MHARRCNPDASTSFTEFLRNRNQVIDESCYFRQIEAFRKHFPDDHIMVVFLEDVKSNPQDELEKVFRFLAVAPDFLPPDVDSRYNVSREGRFVYGPIHRLRWQGWFVALKNLIPGFVRDAVKHLLSSPASAPEWDADFKRELIGRLQPEAIKLLNSCGKADDFWEF
jgi:hypothetical protein